MFIKKLTALITALILCLSVAACAESQESQRPDTQEPVTQEPDSSQAETPDMPEDPDAFQFTRENFPKLDGSTSTVPLAQAVCSVLLGESREQVADLVSFSRTTASYRALMDGKADLLLAAEPEKNYLDLFLRQDKWLMTPFATEALVFVVQEDNPVDDLTIEQIRGIYSGQITNWKDVGGEDEPIVAYQRNRNAGSQAIIQKIVMGDTPFMDPPADYIATMDGMMAAVREFDGGTGALGYTVFYYATDMEMAEGLKILSVDGVTPSDETIASGEYPILNPYYVSIAKDAPEDSPTRILYDWILSPQGQELVRMEGYVPYGG